MKAEHKSFLNNNNLGLLDHTGYDHEITKVYDYFQIEFEKLLEFNAEVYDIESPIFYIKEGLNCNAFAQRIKGRNVIGITQGYPILMNTKFTDEFFDKIIFAAFINEKDVSDAFADLYDSNDFKFEKYMLDCSIQYTFYHEFRHIRQFEALSDKCDLFLSENFSDREFDLKKHIWEYDADKSAAHQVVLFALSTYRQMEHKTEGKLKCLLYCALASLVVTKCLFNFGLIGQLTPPYKVNITAFYTEKNWHPHPTVRALNLLDSFSVSIDDGLSHLAIDIQDLLNNCLGIAKLYFGVLLPTSDVGKLIFNDMFQLVEEANRYNDLLHSHALNEPSIKKLIKNN